MSYQFWSSVELWTLPGIAWVFALAATVRRKRYQRMLCALHDAPPGQLPEPPARISWSQGMLIMFCLLPLRLVAGRRPLLGTASRRGRPLTAKQVSALEIQLGLREPEDPIEEFDDPRLGSRTGHRGGETPSLTTRDECIQATFSIPPAQIADGDVLGSLRARRQQVWLVANHMADQAAGNWQAFSIEEHYQWERLMEEMDSLDRRIKSILDMRERVVAQVTTVKACMPSCTDPTHVVNIRAIGDKQDVWIPATPEHQAMVLSTEASDYERGRDAGHDLIRRLGDRDA